MECTRPDISERLIMALFPEDFPEERQAIQEHVQTCSSCRKELDMLRNLTDTLREHRSEFADAVSECPSAAEIVRISLDETVDPAVQRHLDHCCECRDQAELVKDLASEGIPTERTSAPTPEEKLIVRNAVQKVYGRFSPPEPRSSLASMLKSLVGALHMPSLALGAVAAALLVVVLAPWTTKEIPSRLVLSDARWEMPTPQTMTKGGESLVTPRKVALIILVQEGAGVSAEEVGKIYGKLDLARRLGDQYELMSPVDVKKALAGLSKSASHVLDATRLVLEKTDADHVLAFRIGGSGHKVNVAGSLFERSNKRLLGFSSWDGVAEDRLSEKIVLIGTELLSGAEPS